MNWTVFTFVFLSVIVAGVAKAVSDFLSHYRSNQDLWWGNSPSRKYKANSTKPGNHWYYFGIYTPAREERFIFSSTILVWLTDGWHFFNAVQKVAWIFAILVAVNFTNWIWFTVGIYLFSSGSFFAFYNYLKDKYLS
jgi:hypothetical protein